MQVKIKKWLILLGIMVIVSSVGILFTWSFSGNMLKKQNKITIVTSFYPMYIATKNIVDNIENIELICLTQNQTGCLHDYQMTTQDMKKIENADIFIINGGGIESFIERVVKMYPDLFVINASEGIPFLPSTETHVHDHQEENEEEYNPHVWLNPSYYSKQIENITKGLSAYNGENKNNYNRNSKIYLSQVEELKIKIEKELKNPVYQQVVLFHDAFAYLADAIGIKVIYTVDMDEETSLSAGEIAEVINKVKQYQVKVLLTEKQYNNSIANRISEETKAKTFVVDSLVTGEDDKSSYIKGMEYNIEILKKALYEE